jgi:hypothetical protein
MARGLWLAEISSSNTDPTLCTAPTEGSKFTKVETSDAQTVGENPYVPSILIREREPAQGVPKRPLYPVPYAMTDTRNLRCSPVGNAVCL